jgi:ubiquinone/menaquinone biosynthesis C-methylase UbiE
VAAASIAAAPGTPEFFAAFDRLREDIEPASVQERVYAFAAARGKRVLDVGCGNGYVLSCYVRAGARAFGVDLTRTAVELARTRFGLSGLTGTFLQADAERLPCAAESFDLVTSMGVLHHTPDIERAVREIRRVLRPGGEILLMLYHRNSLHYRLLYPIYGLVRPAFRGWSPAEIARRIDGADNPIGRTYSRREMRALLAGFRDVRLQAASLPARPFRALPGGDKLRDVLARGAGWFLYARATRPA